MYHIDLPSKFLINVYISEMEKMFSIKDRFSFEYEEYIGNIFLTDSLDKHHEKENQGEI